MQKNGSGSLCWGTEELSGLQVHESDSGERAMRNGLNLFPQCQNTHLRCSIHQNFLALTILLKNFYFIYICVYVYMCLYIYVCGVEACVCHVYACEGQRTASVS